MAITGAQAQGALTNGARHTGQISPAGDADSWTFSANSGDSIFLRVGATNFTPRIRLFGPDNAAIAETTSGNTITRDGFLMLQATNSGTYTVIVSATFATQSGAYGLHFALAPETFIVSDGDEGGVLTNGVFNTGEISLGDLDLWSFNANAGDGIMLRVGSTNFTPWIRLYGPNGALVDETTSGNTITRDGVLTLQATNAGPYTVVVSATYANQSGGYGLHLALAPEAFVVSAGDEGGTLTNGVFNTGEISLGDLDIWNFNANAGDGIMLRVGSTNFTPWIRLYGPNGTLVDETTSGNTITRDGVLTLQATNAGPYTVVVSATYANQSGGYGLHLALAPEAFVVSAGDQGGVLTNGVFNTGEISLGDLDLWNFDANAGDGIMLRVGSTNFTPWIRLYGPDGALVNETLSGNTITRDGVLTLQATNAGPYTVVVSATYANQSGSYDLNLALAPDVFVVSDGDQGGSLTNGFVHPGNLALGDIDLWTFYGTPGDSNVLRVTGTTFTPWIRLYGPDGALIKETTTGNTIARNGSLALNITNAGNYTVAVSATYSGQSGAYTFKESRVPPDLLMPETLAVGEGTPINVSISAQDPDEPVKPLVFNLISAPPGMSLTLGGPTNATLSWATSEADGPSTNIVVATVTDVVNGKSFIRTNSFTVFVSEVNSPPEMTVPGNQTLDELTPLSVSALALDHDLPTNALTFSLMSPPEGMAINPQTGEISWTPTEAQGPSTNAIMVVVTDNNPWAINAQQLSITNSFNVIVREVNSPPKLTLPPDQTLDELTALNVSAAVMDVDLPANVVTFSLVSGPDGLTINPATGAISWTPTEAQGPSTNIVAVKVQDDGSPALAATGTFTVVVKEVNSPPVLPVQANRTVSELVSLSVTNSATDSDLPANLLSYILLSAPTNAVISPTGIVTWTPTEEQGPSTNLFTIVVTDNGAPAYSATNTFTIIVNEVNTAPFLQNFTNQTVHYDTPISLKATASDADLPANTLSFSLDQAPTNMTINASSGAITWTPAQTEVGTHPITVRVTDDGSPSMSATSDFVITVTGEGVQLGIQPLTSGLMQLTINGDTGYDYELQKCTEFSAWDKLLQFRLSSSPYSYIDAESETNVVRFYRLKLVQ